jgi:hypothetical protein
MNALCILTDTSPIKAVLLTELFGKSSPPNFPKNLVKITNYVNQNIRNTTQHDS